MANPNDLAEGYYLIYGAKGYNLTRDGAGRVTLGTPDELNPAIFYVKGMNDHAGNPGITLMEIRSRKKIRAAASSGPEPVGPPPAGASLTFVDSTQSCDDYDIWKTRTWEGQTVLCASNSPDAPIECINIAGSDSDWKPAANIITWPWSGGKPNELWSFQKQQSALTPDQQNLADATLAFGDGDAWQSFTPAYTGLLKRVDISVGSFPDSSAIGTINIHDGVGIGGALLYSQAITIAKAVAPPVFQRFELWPSVIINNGKPYTIRMTTTNSANFDCTSADAYKGGTNKRADVAWRFRTWMLLT